MKLTQTKSNFQTNVDESNSMNFGIGNVEVVIDILRNRLYENKIQTLKIKLNLIKPGIRP